MTAEKLQESLRTWLDQQTMDAKLSEYDAYLMCADVCRDLAQEYTWRANEHNE